MRHLGCDVHVFGALERAEIFAEGVPSPLQSFVQGRSRDVLDAFHQFHELVVVLVVHRCETNPAVAEHNGCDAMPTRRLHAFIPGGLPVVVGVDVDEAGGDQRSVCVDLAASRSADPTYLADHAIVHGNICGTFRGYPCRPQRCRL